MLKKKVFIVLALAVIVTLTGCSKFSRYGSDKNVLMQSVSGEGTEGEEKTDTSEETSKEEKQESVNSQEQSENNKDSSADKTGVPQKYQKDEQFLNSPSAEWKNIDFKDYDMYAAAYLDYQDSSSLEYYKENYLNSDNIETYNISGEEYYLIIPKSADMKVQIYKLSMENDKEELIQEFDKAVPFIVCCNISDIFPDCKIVFTTADGNKSVEFSPFISLKDGSFQIGENGIDITKADK